MNFLRNILLNNAVIKIVSLILAVLTWMYVARQLYIENIAKEEEISPAIQVSGEQLIIKRLPIYVNIEGSPFAGYKIALDKIIVEPPHSVLSGPPEVVNSLSYLITEPVNINGASTTVRKSIRIMPIPKCKIGYEGLVTINIPITKEKRNY
jgi:YbbR domain-containing protein